MKYYAHETTGVYLGAFGNEVTPPADSIEVPLPPSIAGLDAYGNPIQTWDNEEEAWLPEVNPNPDPVGFLTALAYDIVNGDSPWQMFQFFFVFQWQGTAQNPDLDTLRKAAYARLQADSTITSTWFSSAYQARLESIAAQYNMDLV